MVKFWQYFYCFVFQDPQRKRHRVKPAPKLFDENKVREIGGEITKERDYWVFEGNRYKNGFMYKPMAMSALVSEITIYNLKFK